MAILRIKYQNGQFTPLDPVPPIEEGKIFEIPVSDETPEDLDAKIDEMLDRTRGMWADIADEIEFYIQDSREKMAQAEKEKWEYLFSLYDEEEK